MSSWQLTGGFFSAFDVADSTTASLASVKTAIDAVKAKTDSLNFTIAGQVDSNVLDWKSATAPAMSGDAYARLGAPAGASIAADVAAVKAVDDAIKLKTDNLPSDPADASDISGAFATVNGTLSTIAGYIDTEVAAIKAKTDNLPASPAAVGSAMTLTSAYDAAKTAAQAGNPMTLTSAYDPAKTAAQAGDAMALTPGERTTLASVVWAALTSGLSTVGSIGKRIVDYLTGDVFARLGAPAGASIAADVAAVKSVDDAIKAKTDNLPSDPADASDISGAFSTVNNTLSTIAGYVDTEVATLLSRVGTPAGASLSADVAAVAGYVDTEVATLLTRIGTPAGASLAADVAAVKTDTAAVKAKTDNLPAAPASSGDVSTVGTAVSAVATSVSAIKAKTDDLTFTVDNELDVNIQSVNDVTVNGTGTSLDPWGP